jgi:hypothetical protein
MDAIIYNRPRHSERLSSVVPSDYPLPEDILPDLDFDHRQDFGG